MKIAGLEPNHVAIKLFTSKNKISSRRAVSPIIATLLLVAIAVVGGSGVFVFAQDHFGSSQISGSPQIEFIQIIGYDARDVEKLNLHDGNEILAKNCCGIANGKKNFDERIAIYIQSNSVHSIVISELRFAGDVYSFAPVSKIGEWNKIGMGHKPHPNEYIIVNGHNEGKNYSTVQESSPVIQPGEVVTILLDLGINMGINHDSQIKITTANGNVFVSTILVGQTIG
jgi:flagellin-like protein